VPSLNDFGTSKSEIWQTLPKFNKPRATESERRIHPKGSSDMDSVIPLLLRPLENVDLSRGSRLQGG